MKTAWMIWLLTGIADLGTTSYGLSQGWIESSGFVSRIYLWFGLLLAPFMLLSLRAWAALFVGRTLPEASSPFLGIMAALQGYGAASNIISLRGAL